MTTETWSDSVNVKIQELCQAVLEGPWLKSIQARMEAFEGSDDAQARMQAVNEKGEHLRHKQAQGVVITPEEIQEFEQLRDAFFESSVARGFVEAQEEMREMKGTVERHLTRTLELGRLPSPEDFGGGCGSGCGCGH